MTRAAKIVYPVALAVGLLVGILIGFSTGTFTAKDDWYGMALVAPTKLRQFAMVQAGYANADNGRTALLGYIDLLKQMEASRPEWKRQSEIAECYARLAMLAEQSGNKERAHALFESARNLYASSKMSSYSDAELENAILKVDQIKQQHGLPY